MFQLRPKYYWFRWSKYRLQHVSSAKVQYLFLIIDNYKVGINMIIINLILIEWASLSDSYFLFTLTNR